MRLSTKVVNLVRTHFTHQLAQVVGIAQIAVVQLQLAVLGVRVLVDPVDAPRVERGGPTDDPVDLLIPLPSRNSARYEPSCPVMPVMRCATRVAVQRISSKSTAARDLPRVVAAAGERPGRFLRRNEGPLFARRARNHPAWCGSALLSTENTLPWAPGRIDTDSGGSVG